MPPLPLQNLTFSLWLLLGEKRIHLRFYWSEQRLNNINLSPFYFNCETRSRIRVDQIPNLTRSTVFNFINIQILEGKWFLSPYEIFCWCICWLLNFYGKNGLVPHFLRKIRNFQILCKDCGRHIHIAFHNKDYRLVWFEDLWIWIFLEKHRIVGPLLQQCWKFKTKIILSEYKLTILDHEKLNQNFEILTW